MDMKQYQSEAHVTASTSFYGDFVCANELIRKLDIAIAAIADVDKIKKQLFYGRNIEGLQTISMPVSDLLMSVAEQSVTHALIGVGTEGGECLELLRDFMNSVMATGNGVFDHAKVMEELGGAMWYIPIGAQAMGVTMGDIAKLNIGQLRVRYAGKFDAYEANNRNLAAENLRMEQLSGNVAANAELSGRLSSEEVYIKDFPNLYSESKNIPVLTELGKPTADEEKRRYIGQTFDPNC